MITIDVNNVAIEKIEFTEQKITLKGVLVSSWESFKSASLVRKDDTILIKIKGRFAYEFLDNNDMVVVDCKGDFLDINEIYLVDRHKTRRIWSRQT